ncbi:MULTISPECIES: mechanosensitive ion channel domain-containing protein [unclassified Salinibacterium]|uniref:mechanosensitive ion channel family protein n=1 Tax=unclassified Salinibacterium TaxID=2632331 RepID=UPI00141E9E17|nr:MULTISPECIES: mechanosensitive ion channel domain-containing protein [unclassified Salinibacterium]
MDAFDWAGFWAGWAAFWVAWQPLITVILTLIGAFIAVRLLRFAIERVVTRIVNGAKKKQNVNDTQALMNSPLTAARTVQRTRALGSVLNSVATATIIVITVLALISTLLPNATGAFAVISAAVGAGLGFGAQNIVKDVLNGLFMVAEDQLGVGDVVDTGFATGVVEGVGIRITQVRDVNGTLWFVRNGEILRVGNMSQGWARVIIDMAVPYDTEVETIQQHLLKTATTMANDGKWRHRILEKPEIWGIESVSAEAVVVRLVVKTRSASKDDVARELRARLKQTLDDIGVRLPALNSLVVAGAENSGRRGSRVGKTSALPVPTNQAADPGPKGQTP